MVLSKYAILILFQISCLSRVESYKILLLTVKIVKMLNNL